MLRIDCHEEANEVAEDEANLTSLGVSINQAIDDNKIVNLQEQKFTNKRKMRNQANIFAIKSNTVVLEKSEESKESLRGHLWP